MYVYVQGPPWHDPTPEEQKHIDRLVAAFLAKKGVTPVGDWRVSRRRLLLFLWPSPTPRMATLWTPHRIQL
jgi:hypothetical protein